jgi:hypothetical protein
MKVITPCTTAPAALTLQSGMPSRWTPELQGSARTSRPPGRRCCSEPGNPGIVVRVAPAPHPARPAPDAPGTQGTIGVAGATGAAGWCTPLIAPATFRPVAPALQPDPGMPDTPTPHGAACAAGVPASNTSAARQPQRAPNEAALIVTARERSADRLAADMRLGPFRDWRRARLDAARHGWRGRCRAVARFVAHTDCRNLHQRVERIVNDWHLQ